MLYLGIMFLLTVMFLPRGLAGFIIMHQLAWVRGNMKLLVKPYIVTAIPALLFTLCAIALIEMSHTEDEVFHYLGLALNPASPLTWIVVLAIGGGAFYATKRSLVQLHDAWETANAIPKEEEA